MTLPDMPETDSLDLGGLKEYVGKFTLENGKMVKDVIDLEKRRPLLIVGELANPVSPMRYYGTRHANHSCEARRDMQNMGR